MLARSSTVGLAAAIALWLALYPTAGYFTLESSGALRVAAVGDQARYGMVQELVNHRPVVVISLGATRAAGSLSLYTYGDEALRPGRYPVVWSLPQERAAGREFHTTFVAGSPERPLGVFTGESGWVTITHAELGRISGEFEIQARGFLAAAIQDEERLVTVRGSFIAEGDSTELTSRAVSAALR
jgi:hypothetical protein